MRTAHRNGFVLMEDKVLRALESSQVSLEEGVTTVFTAGISVRACTVSYLSQACESVGTAPQAELRALADRL